MKTALLEEMMIFARVVEYRSFSKAAAVLHLSKATVSKRITHLETVLRVRLLNRSTRSLSLTQAGSTLYESCQRIDEELHTAEGRLSQLHGEAVGTLKICSPVGLGEWHLAPLLSQFMRKHPHIQIDLFLQKGYINMIEKGYDIMLYMGTPPESNLISRHIATVGTRVCASPQYLQKYGTPTHPKALVDHHCLVYREWPYQDEWQFMDGRRQRFRVKIGGKFHANHSGALREAAIAGLGITMLPCFLLNRPLQEQQLKTILSEYCPKDIFIHGLYPHKNKLAAKIQLLLDFLTANLGPHLTEGTR